MMTISIGQILSEQKNPFEYAAPPTNWVGTIKQNEWFIYKTINITNNVINLHGRQNKLNS